MTMEGPNAEKMEGVTSGEDGVIKSTQGIIHNQPTDRTNLDDFIENKKNDENNPQDRESVESFEQDSHLVKRSHTEQTDNKAEDYKTHDPEGDAKLGNSTNSDLHREYHDDTDENITLHELITERANRLQDRKTRFHSSSGINSLQGAPKRPKYDAKHGSNDREGNAKTQTSPDASKVVNERSANKAEGYLRSSRSESYKTHQSHARNNKEQISQKSDGIVSQRRYSGSKERQRYPVTENVLPMRNACGRLLCKVVNCTRYSRSKRHGLCCTHYREVYVDKTSYLTNPEEADENADLDNNEKKYDNNVIPSNQMKSTDSLLFHLPENLQKGSTGRFLCKVVGCAKYCQTKCNGLCKTHFKKLHLGGILDPDSQSGSLQLSGANDSPATEVNADAETNHGGDTSTESSLTCRFCFRTFSSSTGLTSHSRRCKDKLLRSGKKRSEADIGDGEILEVKNEKDDEDEKEANGLVADKKEDSNQDIMKGEADDEQSAVDNPRSILKQKGPSLKKRQCLTCRKWISVYGFYMHSVNCKEAKSPNSGSIPESSEGAIIDPSQEDLAPDDPSMAETRLCPSCNRSILASGFQMHLSTCRKTKRSRGKDSERVAQNKGDHIPTNKDPNKPKMRQCHSCDRWISVYGFHNHSLSCKNSSRKPKGEKDMGRCTNDDMVGFEIPTGEFSRAKQRQCLKSKKDDDKEAKNLNNANENVDCERGDASRAGIPHIKMRQCPRCSRWISVYGFYMHSVSCEKAEKIAAREKDRRDGFDSKISSSLVKTSTEQIIVPRSEMDGLCKGFDSIPFWAEGMINRRRLLVDPRDPRPCFGCLWCGPKLRKGQNGEEMNPSMCAVCRHLREHGWNVRYYNGSTHFNDEAGKDYGSVKVFLIESSKLLFSKNVKISILEQSKTEDQVEAATAWTKHLEGEHAAMDLPEGEKTRINSPKSGNSETKQSELRNDNKNHPEAKNAGTEQSEVQNAEIQQPEAQNDSSRQPNVDDVATKQYVSDSSCKKQPESGGIDTKHPASPSHNGKINVKEDTFVMSERSEIIMQKRKRFVRTPDPRPCYGCDWCGPTLKPDLVGDRNAEVVLCAACQLFQEVGWSCKFYEGSRVFLDETKKRYKSIKEYLCKTTGIICKKLNAMSPADRNKILMTKPIQKRPLNTGAQKSLADAKNEAQNNDALVSTSGSADEQAKDTSLPIKVSEGASVRTIELPKISQLLKEKEGLMGVLREDSSRTFNSHFGTNANIAAKILMSLCEGQLPPSVFQETPFIRPIDELRKLSSLHGAPPTRFIGVCRLGKSLNDGKIGHRFGVAIPQFYVDYNFSENPLPCKHNGYIIPRASTVKGQTLLIRADIEDEEVAGQLFSFLYRIMYGKKAVLAVLKDTNRPEVLSLFGPNQMCD